jgi:hypothetical protein
MFKTRQIYAEITELYDEQGLAADEIAAIVCQPLSFVEEVIDDFEAHLDTAYGAY